MVNSVSTSTWVYFLSSFLYLYICMILCTLLVLCTSPRPDHKIGYEHVARQKATHAITHSIVTVTAIAVVITAVAITPPPPSPFSPPLTPHPSPLTSRSSNSAVINDSVAFHSRNLSYLGILIPLAAFNRTSSDHGGLCIGLSALISCLQ